MAYSPSPHCVLRSRVSLRRLCWISFSYVAGIEELAFGVQYSADMSAGVEKVSDRR